MSVYNSGKYLPATLASIQDQTITDIRIIIVDDGSTDNTKDIVLTAQKTDPRIVYQYQDNAGIVAAVNAGMSLCDAPFVARHDGDDISYPDRFQKELAYLEANEGCVAVSALARHIREDDSPIGTVTRAKDMALVNDKSLPANEPYIMQPLLMMRREAYVAAGGYRLLSVSEDADLYWRLRTIGTLHIMPEVLGDYRIHGDSISSKSIVSGRRMSAWTQLSALSAQRRRRCLPDIEFTPDLQKLVDKQDELIDLYRTCKPLLQDDAEKRWFYSALAAKLIEMCYYRPFEPKTSDVDYILAAPVIDPDLTQREFYKVYAAGILSAGIRLAVEGEFRLALRLVPREQRRAMIARAAFRKILSPNLRNRVKKIARAVSHLAES
jgi:glycosyltransferase involved in cell wall biosynthesis